MRVYNGTEECEYLAFAAASCSSLVPGRISKSTTRFSRTFTILEMNKTVSCLADKRRGLNLQTTRIQKVDGTDCSDEQDYGKIMHKNVIAQRHMGASDKCGVSWCYVKLFTFIVSSQICLRVLDRTAVPVAQ